MGDEQTCPRCNRPLRAKPPLGLCPECLMEAGFATGAVPEINDPTARAVFTPPTLEQLATLFPQLEILELLGQGGMGAVYKARQTHLDRVVALKILPPGIGADAAFAERFTREAKALARLNHTGIVTLYESGQTNGLYFFLMEYVDGVSLRHLLAGKKLSPREALAIVPQICDALQYAHDQGIVHRDIKPENILLDRQGRVKVADFGLAKLVKNENAPLPDTAGTTPTGGENATSTSEGTPDRYALTQPGTVMGTPRYMAPEQREHPTEVDHRADIYSLGVVFYEMLTGEAPAGQFQPPSRKAAIDVRLDEVVMGALAKEPEERYQQANEVKADVEKIATIPVATPTEVAASEIPEWSSAPGTAVPHLNKAPFLTSRRRSALLAGLTVAFLLFSTSGIVWLVKTKPSPQPGVSDVTKDDSSPTADPLAEPPSMNLGNLELPPTPPLPDIFVSELKPLLFTSGYEQPRVNKTINGKPLTLGGKTYKRGLGTHAHGEALFAIPQEARRFVAVVGLDDAVADDVFGRGSVCFEVYGDVNDPGEMPVLLGKSPVLSPNTARSWAFDLDLESRFARIQLIVSDAGDGIDCDHADWVNAGFLKSARDPTTSPGSVSTSLRTNSPNPAEANLPALWGLTSNLVLKIPPRDTNAGSKQIDLTDFYNGDLIKNWHSFWEKGNDLRELPTGLQTMADTLFDVRGVIAVNQEGEKKGHLPPMVEGIRIGQKCAQVHFLHGAFNAAFSNLEQIGHYRIRFANGQQEVIPIVTGRDVLDWHNKVPAGSPLVVAWEGDNPKTRQHPGENRKIHLFKSTWENPTPDVEIQTIDLVSRLGPPSPFLVAITVE